MAPCYILIAPTPLVIRTNMRFDFDLNVLLTHLPLIKMMRKHKRSLENYTHKQQSAPRSGLKPHCPLMVVMGTKYRFFASCNCWSVLQCGSSIVLQAMQAELNLTASFCFLVFQNKLVISCLSAYITYLAFNLFMQSIAQHVLL